MAIKKPLVLDSTFNLQQIQTGDYIDVAYGGTGANTAAGARTALGLSIGSIVQAWGAGLDAIQALSTTGQVVRTSANNFATRSLVAPAAGISVSNGDGVAANPTLALANDLAALEGLASVGLAVRTATDTWTQRTIAGNAGRVSVTNPDGVAGNPTIDLIAVTNAGGGTLQKFTQDSYGRVSGSSAVATADLTALLSSTYLSLTGGTLTGPVILAADPTSAMGAVTKQYADAIAAGLTPKPSVKAMSATNVTVSNPGGATFDGIAFSVNDRLLLTGQTASAENGPWVFNGSGVALTRPVDFNLSSEVQNGSTFFVDQGTNNSDSNWTLVSSGPYTLGTTALTFTQTSGLGQISTGNGLSKAGSTLSAVVTARLAFNGGAIDLASGIATAGTFTKLTVDTYGRVTAGATATPSDVGAQASSAELTGVAGLSATGLVARTGAGSYSPRSIVAPGAGISITNPDGVAGSPTLALANDLAALEALNGTGFATRTAVDTWTQRTFTGTAGRVTVTNGDGVSGAPTIDLVSGIVAPGTYGLVTVDAFGRVTSGSGASVGVTISSQLVNDETVTIPACTPVYSDAAGGVKRAIANAAAASQVVGLAVADITTTATGAIATSGEVTATTGQWDAVTSQTGGLTFGALYFLDNTTVGKITTTAPSSGYVISVGQALSATKMLVRVGVRIQL